MLARYPQESAKILHRDIFWFFLNDEEFVSRTINDSNIDSNKFLESKVCQLAKKMESSKATAKHVKQFASDPQMVQVNLLWHQCTEIPPSKSNKKKTEPSSLDKKPTSLMNTNQKCHMKIKEDLILNAQDQTDVQNVMTHNSEKGLGVQQASTSVRFVIHLATLVACATGREMACIITKGPWVHPGHTN